VKVYIGGRASGKTLLTVNWYRKNPGAKILVASGQRKYQLWQRFGVPFEDIITPTDLELQKHRRIPRDTKIAMDGVEEIFISLWQNLLSQIGPHAEVVQTTFDTTWFDNHFDTVYLTEEKTRGIVKEFEKNDQPEVHAQERHARALSREVLRRADASAQAAV
jgi:hypothetical protein